MPKTPVSSLKHSSTRANIPTEETKRFMTPEQAEAKPVHYPRDPSLDPQLVWKGKDEQDSAPLEVPSVPIYIQEKIHPQALIEELRAFAAKERNEEQAQLFSDFNGLTLEQQVEFYRHSNHWSNRMILGDSLLTMTSLAEREGLKGKVQMIYLDPPYGIKFGSNWQVSTRKRDVKDTGFDNVTRQPEQIKAFRDTWELGIHSYLSYLRDRLVVARELLTESGSIFVQIGDENVHLVRCLMDEVIGSENYVALIAYKKPGQRSSDTLPMMTDFILWYAKTKSTIKYRPLLVSKALGGAGGDHYSQVEFDDGEFRALSSEERIGSIALPQGARAIETTSATSAGSQSGEGLIEFEGKRYYPPVHKHWSASVIGMNRLMRAGRIVSTPSIVRYKRYFDDFAYMYKDNRWDDPGLFGESIYVVQTSATAIENCLLMTTDPGDLVLDPTCGSGTTAYVAEQWGRRWITIDTSRVALALARTRLMSGKFPFYLLADTEEGKKKEESLGGGTSVRPENDAIATLGGTEVPPPRTKAEGDVRKGFVWKRVPHVTLKSIANNDEIDAIHAKWQLKLEPLRAEINKLAGLTWEEWEVPRLPSEDIPEEIMDEVWKPFKKLGIEPKSILDKKIREYYSLRRNRQKEIDASIARHADTETLYDQPYEDKKRVRVTGPFTVESLSPHRFLNWQDKIEFESQAQRFAIAGTDVVIEDSTLKIEPRGPGDFEPIILDNLRKAGAQNTFKGERLKFDTLDPFPGQYLHGAGEISEKDGTVRKVAVCVGPEYGTVSTELLREAAREAVKGVGFDILLVTGFNFMGMSAEETTHYGRLTVLRVLMKPELNMGDGLLKKTGAGNLFQIVGEPDIEIKRTADGKVEVEVKGMDVYDPTIGEVRSSSPDEIACWFIDTDYNGDSFFVRHAYFTGADKPYERLSKTLKADIDESAWDSLYRTTSRPFDAPKKGKIAVKVINHFGDEVLKVYGVEG